MDDFIKIAEKFALAESERTGAPPKAYLELSRDKGQALAENLGADTDIVRIGTTLMDCQLGQAISEGRPEDHVDMSFAETNKLLDTSKLSDKEKENIRRCVDEHHGRDKFFSLESEICCNADCYRFASMKGFLKGLRYTRDMDFEDLLKLLDKKADEKWNAISIDIVREELEPQYKTIKALIELQLQE